MSDKKKPVSRPATLASHLLLAGACLLLLAAVAAWWYVQQDVPLIEPSRSSTIAARPAASPAPSFVAEQACQGCHQAQFKDWQSSHHQQAMQKATPEYVLGDFADVTFEDPTQRTRFFRKDGDYWVNTPGADGQPADFKVAYTFGVEPLQQYLLEYPGGRLQALGVAWDTQKQRWFSLHPGASVDYRDPLHWTKPAYNANFMCVECHTTGFKRNFDAASDTFSSHWQALGVGCQSCHGPASRHLQWAATADRLADKGFAVTLKGSEQTTQVETCARCHARRAPLADGFEHSKRLMDDYLPSPLTQALYELDGKIKDEVFEYGAFSQSRMYAKGVTCTDCHNPHSAKLVAEGNGVCLQCHNTAGRATRPGIDATGLQAKNYDAAEHHRHAPGSAGAQCVSCHMPGKYYMGNDYRHDHGFTIPDPARARTLGTTDACLGCHAGKPERVVEQFRLWYSTPNTSRQGYTDALAKARGGQPGAAQALHQALQTADLPAVRRATLLAELARYPGRRALELAASNLNQPEPQVRQAAVEAVADLAPPQQLAGFLAPRLADPIRAVRMAAAWRLAQLPPQALGNIASALSKPLREYETAQLQLAERAEANFNRALLYQATNRPMQVESALRAALTRDPDYLPAHVHLSQWLETVGQAEEAQRLLDDAIVQHPQAGLLRHAQGLSQVRKGEHDRALQAFTEAVRLEPDNEQFRFVLAVALHDRGDKAAAVQQLQTLLKQHPANRGARLTLVEYLRANGMTSKAQTLLTELAGQNPDDPALGRY